MISDDQNRCMLAFRRLRPDWPPGTELIVVEVHDGDQEHTWDLVAYPMDRAGTQVDGIAEYVLEGVLIHGAVDARQVSEWAAEAWKLAGADRLPWPTYVAPHDHWQSVDVVAGRWVEDATIYGA